LFNSNGFINQGIGLVGIEPVGWLTRPGPAFAAVLIVNIWIGIAFNLVLLHSGLQGISEERYEAAELDGAGYWRRVWHISLPGLRPVTAIVLTLGVIFTLRQFEIIWAMTRGGPGNSTHLLSTLAYSMVFDNSRFGAGASVANLLFMLTLVIVAVYIVRLRKEDQP
jgi:multiple sugar transport system permease protein